MTSTTKPEPIPTWLRDHLVATGRMTRDGITRAARIHPCPRCGGRTLAGFDADHCYGVARCQPAPLTALGEMVAQLDDPPRATYALWRIGDRLELEWRDRWQIAGHPAGGDTNRFDVLAEHRCGAPIPAPLAASTWITAPPRSTADTDAPQF